MNVLILIDTMKFGGAEKQALLDANALADCGMSVILACFQSGPLASELNKKVKLVVLDESSYIGRIRSVVDLIRSSGTDLIFSHMIIAEIVAAFSGFLTRKYVVLNEHGLGTRRRMIHRLGMFAASKLADRVWCASNATRKIRIKREWVADACTRVVYNCFTPFPAQSDSDESGRKVRDTIVSAREGGRVVAGFVGRFDPVKRLDILVHAAEKLGSKNILFVLVGDGIDMGRIESMIKERGLQESFSLPGFVHNPGEYYEMFDFFVLPSIRESLSMALLEAGSKSLPVVAFDVGGNSEIVQNNETGLLVQDGDLEGFVESLSRISGDKELRRSMGVRAQQFVTETFSGEARVNALLEECDKARMRS